MWIGAVGLMPQMFSALTCGVTGRAIENGLLTIDHFNPRDYTTDRHRTVDDTSYGGGPGMVMKLEPLKKALLAAQSKGPQDSSIIVLSPQGKLLDQQAVNAFSKKPGIILISGRYEGIDERLFDLFEIEQWSIGDYVLSGGELAAMVMIDSVARQLPGVLGDEQSAHQDSFSGEGLLDHPHYTRPEEFEGLQVPEVLLSGDHQAILRWREKMALGLTQRRRPDLLLNKQLSPQQEQMLDEFNEESGNE